MLRCSSVSVKSTTVVSPSKRDRLTSQSTPEWYPNNGRRQPDFAHPGAVVAAAVVVWTNAGVPAARPVAPGHGRSECRRRQRSEAQRCARLRRDALGVQHRHLGRLHPGGRDRARRADREPQDVGGLRQGPVRDGPRRVSVRRPWPSATTRSASCWRHATRAARAAARPRSTSTRSSPASPRRRSIPSCARRSASSSSPAITAGCAPASRRSTSRPRSSARSRGFRASESIGS